MQLKTAFKISGFCLLALAVETLAAYFIWTNYAFGLAESGRYTATEAYSEGPMKTLSRLFYGIFGVTIALGLMAPLLSFLSLIFRNKNEFPKRH